MLLFFLIVKTMNPHRKLIMTIFSPVSKNLFLQDQKPRAYLIGSIGVSGKTKWDILDGVIRRLFKVKQWKVNSSINSVFFFT